MCTKLDYYALWKLMADLIIDLKEVNVEIPSQVMTELCSLKMLIEISKVERSSSDVIRRIKKCLSILESYPVPIACERFGDKYIKVLMSISEARKKIGVKLEESFLSGILHGRHWVCAKLTEDASLDPMKPIYLDLKLNHKIRESDLLPLYEIGCGSKVCKENEGGLSKIY
ncbi:hypothetical protein DRO35_00265 [Candidatus Bathyarchaeota archaeon]|nr:MAG: hypothetical protein DRO35_00265 [Candidatus Bathyarchaeota archaeon]